MSGRVRVERAVTDRGFGKGWVVLGPSGAVIYRCYRWEAAFAMAVRFARVLVVAP